MNRIIAVTGVFIGLTAAWPLFQGDEFVERVDEIHVLGKPAAPVEMKVISAELPDEAGRFSVSILVTAQERHEQLAVSAWGAPGVTLDEAPDADFEPGMAGRTQEVRLSGTWSGEGPPRVYVGAEMVCGGRTSSRSLAIKVSNGDWRPEPEGHLDAEQGALVFRIK